MRLSFHLGQKIVVNPSFGSIF